jgi:hypothetical protein
MVDAIYSQEILIAISQLIETSYQRLQRTEYRITVSINHGHAIKISLNFAVRRLIEALQTLNDERVLILYKDVNAIGTNEGETL